MIILSLEIINDGRSVSNPGFKHMFKEIQLSRLLAYCTLHIAHCISNPRWPCHQVLINENKMSVTHAMHGHNKVMQPSVSYHTRDYRHFMKLEEMIKKLASKLYVARS